MVRVRKQARTLSLGYLHRGPAGGMSCGLC